MTERAFRSQRRVHAVALLTSILLLAAAGALLAAGPAVTAPAPSPQLGFLGAAAQFSVTATGTGPFSYAWQLLSSGGATYVSLSDGGRISGSGTATLHISSLQAGDAGSYRCLVSNAGGQTNSGPGSLSVTAPPPPTVSAPGSQTVLAGGTATFSVTASGSGQLSYNWQQSVGGATYVGLNNGDLGGRVSGATGPTLQIANVQPADAGNYRCLVSNAGGQTGSGPGALTVSLPPPPTVTSPNNSTVAAGGTATFVVTASGSGPFNYAWQSSLGGAPFTTLNNGDRGGRIAGATSPALQIAAVQAADAGNYRCLVTNAGGIGNSGPGALTVTSPAPPTVTAPAGQTVAAGGTASFSVTASGAGPFNYAWQVSHGGSFAGLNNGDLAGRVSGATSPTLQIANVQATDAGSYRCVVAGAGGPTNSGAAALTVSASGPPPPTVTAPVAQTVVPGAKATFAVTASGAGPFQFTWQQSLNGASYTGLNNGDLGNRVSIANTATTSTLSIANAQVSDTGNYRCLVGNAGGQANSGAAPLTVSTGTPKVVVTDSAGAQVFVSPASRMRIPADKACAQIQPAVYTINNTGDGALLLGTPQLVTKSGFKAWSATLNGPSTVPPRASVSLTVTYSGCTMVPWGENFQIVEITLSSNAQPYVFDVSGLYDYHTPDQALHELDAAMRTFSKKDGKGTALELCAWRSMLHVDPTLAFGAKEDESDNLPVVAAAVALWADPNYLRDWSTWWPAFLTEQLSPPGTQNSGLAYFFGGEELFSWEYSPKNLAAFAAVRAWASFTSKGGSTGASAAALLRATAGAYALAAAPVPATIAYGIYDGDQPNPAMTFPFTGNGQPFVDGPYLALGGERSSSGRWSNDARAQAFCHALRRDCTGPDGKDNDPEWQAAVFADSAAKLPADDNVFALTAAEVQGLSDLISEVHGIDPSLALSMLGGVRTLTTVHFLAWPGVRATCVENDIDSNTTPTLAAAYNVLGHGEVQLQYPYVTQAGRSDPGRGSGTCAVDLSTHRLNGMVTYPKQDCPTCPTYTVTLRPVIDLPGEPPAYHYTLGPNGLQAVP